MNELKKRLANEWYGFKYFTIGPKNSCLSCGREEIAKGVICICGCVQEYKEPNTLVNWLSKKLYELEKKRFCNLYTKTPFKKIW